MTRQPIPRALMADVWAHLRNRDQRPRAALPDGRGELRITNEAGHAEIYLYDEIGFWGIPATYFVEQLIGIAASRITLHINSPGGDVFDGIAIYNALIDHPAAVDVRVDGLAASAASFIAMSGDAVVMNRASQMMIHDASGLCIGNAGDMGEMQALLDRVSDTIASIYAARAGGDLSGWRDAMRAETWYSAAEAVEAGLADSAVAEKTAEAPAARFDLAMTAFHFAGRAQAPRPAMPGKDRPAVAACTCGTGDPAADGLPVAPGVDEAPTDGDGAAPRAEPAAPPDPAPDPDPTSPAEADEPVVDEVAPFPVAEFRAGIRAALHRPAPTLHTPKEAVS